MYLQEMGNIPLLSREEEVTVAKEIEAGEKHIRQEIFSAPLALQYILSLGERLKRDENEARFIFGDEGEGDEEEGAEATRKEDPRIELFLSRMGPLKRLAGEREKAEKLSLKRSPVKEREKVLKRLIDLQGKVRTSLDALPLGRRHITIVVDKLKEVGLLLEKQTRTIRRQESLHNCQASEILALSRIYKNGAPRDAKEGKESSKAAHAQKIREASQIIKNTRKEIQRIEDRLGTNMEKMRRSLAVIAQGEAQAQEGETPC